MAIADPGLLVIAALIVGTLGGVAASVIGYLTTETNGFNGRKFAIAVMTGAIAGIALGLPYASTPDLVEGTIQTQIVLLTTIFLAAVGADFIRNRIGDAQALAAKKTA